MSKANYFQTRAKDIGYIFCTKKYNGLCLNNMVTQPVRNLLRNKSSISYSLSTQHPRFLRKENSVNNSFDFDDDESKEFPQAFNREVYSRMKETREGLTKSQTAVHNKLPLNNLKPSSTRNVVLKIIKEEQRNDPVNSGLMTNSTDLKSIMRMGSNNRSSQNLHCKTKNTSKIALRSKEIRDMNKSLKEDLKNRFPITFSKEFHKFASTAQPQPKVVIKNEDITL